MARNNIDVPVYSGRCSFSTGITGAREMSINYHLLALALGWSMVKPKEQDHE